MSDPLPLVSEKGYAALVDESTWGTLPGSPTYVHIPYDDCNIVLQTKNRKANPYVGLLGKKYSRIISGFPSGDLKTKLYGWHPAGAVSLAQLMLDWGFLDQETAEVRSKTLEKYEGPNSANKRWRGLRCSKAAMQITEENGIDLTLSLIGRYEDGQASSTDPANSSSYPATAQALPTTRYKLGEFVETDVSVSLNSTVIPFAALTRETTRVLALLNYCGTTPQVLRNTDETEMWSITIPKQDDTYDALRRALGRQESTVSVTAKGLHYGTGSTGNYAQVVIAASVLVLESVGETVIQGLEHQVLNFQATKPDSSTARSTHTWSEV